MWPWSRLEAKIDKLTVAIAKLLTQGAKVMDALTALTAQVAANTSAEQSAITLLGGLKAALDAAIASGNPAALTALSAQLGTSQAALAAAIVANTPATPTPAP